MCPLGTFPLSFISLYWLMRNCYRFHTMSGDLHWVFHSEQKSERNLWKKVFNNCSALMTGMSSNSSQHLFNTKETGAGQFGASSAHWLPLGLKLETVAQSVQTEEQEEENKINWKTLISSCTTIRFVENCSVSCGCCVIGIFGSLQSQICTEIQYVCDISVTRNKSYTYIILW